VDNVRTYTTSKGHEIVSEEADWKDPRGELLDNTKAQFGQAQSFELALSNLWTACLSDTGLITTILFRYC
jgi:hypothetical protein